VTALIKEHGNALLGFEYIGKQKGRWISVPTGFPTTGLGYGFDFFRAGQSSQLLARRSSQISILRISDK